MKIEELDAVLNLDRIVVVVRIVQKEALTKKI